MALPVTLDQLEVFSAVARTGGFAEAARELSRTQSAVSKAVATMERLLDIRLFSRSAQGATLTAEGGALMANARAVLDSARQFHSEAERVSSATEGIVSLAIDAFCPSGPVLDALTAAAAKFPGTAVIVRTEHLAQLPRLVLSGTCAVGLCGHQGIEHPELSKTYLRTTAMIPVCAASHPLASAMQTQGSISADVLSEHVHLYLTERADWLSDSPPPHAEGVRERRWWKLSDLGTKHKCLCLGVGWGMMPQHMVDDEISRGVLVRLQLEGTKNRWAHEHFLVRRRDSGGGPVADFLHAALLKNLLLVPG